MSEWKKGAKRSEKPVKAVPTFRAEEDEREFWASHDSSGYADWSKAQVVRFTRLKPPTSTISLRLPESLPDELMIQANQRDVPYPSLLKIYLAERVEHERRRKAG